MTREAWWIDPEFLDAVSKGRVEFRGRASFEKPQHGEAPELYFREGTEYYRSPLSPRAFFHRPVNVKSTTSTMHKLIN